MMNWNSYQTEFLSSMILNSLESIHTFLVIYQQHTGICESHAIIAIFQENFETDEKID